MTLRALPLVVALELFAACECIPARDLIFQCESGRQCPGGLTCCADSTCRPQCTSACIPGALCTTNPRAPCITGRRVCVDGGALCEDAAPSPDGTACESDRVCLAGACTTCVPGLSCEANPNRCVGGVLSCTDKPTCADTTNPRAPGTSCGAGQVCDPDARCVPCAHDGGCTSSPDPCREGQIDCRDGTARCVSSALKPAGSACGTGMVCDPSGACVPCVESASCSSNPDPCMSGVLRCQKSPPCENNKPKSAGERCGVDQVCDPSGRCVACVADRPCANNPDRCKQGQTSCATGAEQCVNTGANQSPGTRCGTDAVCNRDGGCISCREGDGCLTNPNRCKQGVTQCGSGSPVCSDGTPNTANGTPCDGGQTCNSGICGPCVQGSACTGNPSPCVNGTRDCTGAAPACLDGSGTRPAGTACGLNQVCNTSGSCVSCSEGSPCTTNPNRCRAGRVSCVTGSPVCEDAVPVPVGNPCNGGFCDGAGQCTACALGQACTANPGAPCRTGVWTRVGAACECLDDRNAPVGTMCGSSTFDMWTSCAYAATCDTSGTRTRRRTDYQCNTSGTCGSMVTIETDSSGCGRQTDGTQCGSVQCGAFSACSYASACANSGSRTRTCAQPICASGACGAGTPFTDTDTNGCARNVDGTSCGPGTQCGQCDFASVCEYTGIKTCTDYACLNGSCGSGTPYTSTSGCTRDTDFNPCGLSVAGVQSVCIGGGCTCGCVSSGVCHSGLERNHCGSGGSECTACSGIRFCDPDVTPGYPICNFP